MSISSRASFAIARFVAAGIAFYATAKHPYNFYTLTRWIVFAACCWGVFLCRGRALPFLAPAYIVVALTFNPILPFHFSRSTWQILDVAAGVFMLLSIAMHRSEDDSHTRNY